MAQKGTDMKLREYIKDKLGVLLIQGICMLLLSLYLKVTGNPFSVIILILAVWISVLLFYFAINYWQRRKYFFNIFQALEALDQPYLISEVMEPARGLEDRLQQKILRRSNKSVIEKIHQLEDEQREYKEYIESWIHEVKTPITSMNLICENLREQLGDDRLLLELGKIENQMEMVLYYARLEKAYQDYLIKKTNLRDAAVSSIKKNKFYFLENKMQIELDMDAEIVSTDEKWVEFLLNQIFSNCIKYKRTDDARIKVYAKKEEGKVMLIIEDNGCGIKEEELGRIFQKGFTGSNGRSRQYSTGIGLYLCKRLCDKLEIGIRAESKEGDYTRIVLIFPDSSFSKI